MINEGIVLQVALATGFLGFLIKMLPLVLFKKPIENQFVSSFLKYIPFAVLTSMTIPEVFNSTSSIISASCGAVLAIALSYFGQGLLVVSLAATAMVFIVENVFKF